MPYPIDGYIVQETIDHGNTWSGLVRGVYDLNFDKEMIATDDTPSSPYANNLYAAWTDFSGGRSVKFNRSTDGGQTFSAPITLKSGFGQGTNVQTGPNGEVYVCWADYTDGNLPADNIGFHQSSHVSAGFGGNLYILDRGAAQAHLSFESFAHNRE